MRTKPRKIIPVQITQDLYVKKYLIKFKRSDENKAPFEIIQS